MKLQININLSDNCEICIECSHKMVRISDTSKVDFDIDKEDIYDVYVFEPLTPQIHKWLTLQDLLLFPIKGFLSSIFLDNDYDWVKKIRPFCLKAHFQIEMKKDMEISLFYHISSCRNGWRKGKMKVEQELKIDEEYAPNLNDISSQFYGFVKHFCAIVSFSILVVGILAIISFLYDKILLGMIFISIVILAFIISCYYIYKQYTVMKKLESDFRKHISGGNNNE